MSVLNLGILRETTSDVVEAITKGAPAPVPLFQPRLDAHQPAVAAVFLRLTGIRVNLVVIFRGCDKTT